MDQFIIYKGKNTRSREISVLYSSTFKQHCKCKKIIKDGYILWWEKNASVYSNGKLRCYLLFKCNFGFENYLSIVRSFEHRKNMTKLRISAHKLQIEVGRYQGTLLQNRVLSQV